MTNLIVTRWGAQFGNRKLPCSVGWGGIGIKHAEGDGITPRGTWRLAEIWYRPDRVVLRSGVLPQKAIGPRDVWSDDPHDPGYNTHQRLPYPKSHEDLRRADPMYDLFAVTDFNWPEATAGAGSAIFLHTWRKPRHPTAGCVAVAQRDLVWILSRWTERSRLIVL